MVMMEMRRRTRVFFPYRPSKGIACISEPIDSTNDSYPTYHYTGIVHPLGGSRVGVGREEDDGGEDKP